MIAYRDAVPADGPALSVLAKRCFTDTFGTLYRASDLAAFLESTFGDTGLASQLGDPAYSVRVAEADGALAGFAKLGPVAFPGDWGDRTTELHQLYVLGAYHGEGVGPTLMEWVIATARAQGNDRLVLSVFVDNHRAQRFYARYGMREVGRYDFRVGETVDDDRIWSLDL